MNDSNEPLPKTLRALVGIEYATIVIVAIAFAIPVFQRHIAFGNLIQLVWSMYFIQGINRKSSQVITWAWWMLAIQTLGLILLLISVLFGDGDLHLFDTWIINRAWGLLFIALGCIVVVVKFILLRSAETKKFVAENFI